MKELRIADWRMRNEFQTEARLHAVPLQERVKPLDDPGHWMTHDATAGSQPYRQFFRLKRFEFGRNRGLGVQVKMRSAGR